MYRKDRQFFQTDLHLREPRSVPYHPILCKGCQAYPNNDKNCCYSRYTRIAGIDTFDTDIVDSI